MSVTRGGEAKVVTWDFTLVGDERTVGRSHVGIYGHIFQLFLAHAINEVKIEHLTDR